MASGFTYESGLPVSEGWGVGGEGEFSETPLPPARSDGFDKPEEAAD